MSARRRRARATPGGIALVLCRRIGGAGEGLTITYLTADCSTCGVPLWIDSRVICEVRKLGLECRPTCQGCLPTKGEQARQRPPAPNGPRKS